MHPFGNAGVLAGGSEDVALLPDMAEESEDVALLPYLAGESENVASLPYLAGESENVASLPYPAGGSENVASAAYPPPQDFQGIQPLDPSLSLTGDHTHFELHALASQIPPAFSGGTFAGTYGELPGSPDGTSLLSPTSTFADSIGSPTVYGDVASLYGTPTVYGDVASPYSSPGGFQGPHTSPFSGNQLDSLVNSPAYPIGTLQAVSSERVLPSQSLEGFSGQPVSTSFPGNDIRRPYEVSEIEGSSSKNTQRAQRRRRLKGTPEGRSFLAQENSRGSNLRVYRHNYVKYFYPHVSGTNSHSTKAVDVLSLVNAERAKKNEGPWTLQELNTAAEAYVLHQREQERKKRMHEGDK